MNTYPFPRTSRSQQQDGYVLPFMPDFKGLPKHQRPDPRLIDQYIQFLAGILRSEGIDHERPEVQAYIRRMASAAFSNYIGQQVKADIALAIQQAL